jgi:predicted acetyltransferase
MAYEVRLLTRDDLPAAWEMIRIAFGAERERPSWWREDRPGRLDWAVFDESGRMIAKATDRAQGHWFGGRLVPACGIAGVIVAPELRGTGLARLVLTHLLHAARGRGAVIATLFRTSPEVYRAFGCEEVGAMTRVAVPAAVLAELARPRGVLLRPAEAHDVAAVLDAYRALARAGSGLMERSGPLFDTSPEAVLAGHDGLTVAVEGGAVAGYASWDREPGYDESGRLRVSDLIAHTADATTALLAMLGSWSRVTPTISLRLPDPDPAPLLASFVGTRVESREPWMLRVLDAAGAVAARGWPAPVSGAVDLAIDDDLCPWNTGPHRLVLGGGEGRLEPGGSGAVRLTMRGFALLYAGGAGPAILRRAGMLSGGGAESDAFLAAATAGPVPALLDYF